MTDAALTAMLERHAREIGEHVDAVQIVATRTEGAICGLHHRGCGNLYARMAICQEFVDELKAGTAAYQHKQIVCPDDPPQGEPA